MDFDEIDQQIVRANRRYALTLAIPIVLVIIFVFWIALRSGGSGG